MVGIISPVYYSMDGPGAGPYGESSMRVGCEMLRCSWLGYWKLCGKVISNLRGEVIGNVGRHQLSSY